MRFQGDYWTLDRCRASTGNSYHSWALHISQHSVPALSDELPKDPKANTTRNDARTAKSTMRSGAYITP